MNISNNQSSSFLFVSLQRVVFLVALLTLSACSSSITSSSTDEQIEAENDITDNSNNTGNGTTTGQLETDTDNPDNPDNPDNSSSNSSDQNSGTTTEQNGTDADTSTNSGSNENTQENNTPAVSSNNSMPVGIPAPEFGITEKPEDYYQRPDPWNEETPGWYYISQQHPQANNSHTFGTPTAPRATIPDPVPAGSVVVLDGEYNFAPTGYDRIIVEGTKSQPVFFIAEPGAVVTRKWQVLASYLIVDGLEFTDRGKVEMRYPSHHVAFRNGEHHNMAGKFGGSGNSATEKVEHIVIYNNKIHSQVGWNEDASNDLDNHAIKFDTWVDFVWVIGNEGYHNGGSFIQVGNKYAGNDLERNRYYYIGGNKLYENRQSPIEIKQSSDIIISSNTLFNNTRIQSNAAGQGGLYILYGPARIWVINNHIYASNFGIAVGSNSGGEGQGVYIVGNIIHDIAVEAGDDYNNNTAWAPAAVMLAGGQDRYVVNNTILNVDGGIHSPSSPALQIQGNLIANVSRGYHIFLESSLTLDVSSVANNAFFQSGSTPSYRLRNTRYSSIVEFEAAWNNANNSIEGDPLLVAPDTHDFTLSSTSPLRDAGIESPVYQTFENLYGLDIRKDMDGKTRLQGTDWDIGAYESSN